MKWNCDTLYTHVVALREQDQNALRAALAASDKRLDGMNEFREALKNQQGTYISRTEAYTLVGLASASITAIAAIFAIIGHFTAPPIAGAH